MSSVYVDEIVPAVPESKRKKCILQACDLCGVKARSPGEAWEGGFYDVNETTAHVTLSCKTGVVYPECGDTEEIAVDICPACFVNRLIPWLRSQGAVIPEPKKERW